MGLALGLGLGITFSNNADWVYGLGWSALWEASYAGSPWVAKAGSGSLADATNPPAVGGAVNGFTPADFDGTNDKLDGAAASNYVDTGVGTSSTVVALVFVDTVGVAQPTPSDGECLVGLRLSGTLAIDVSTSGTRGSIFDGSLKMTTPAFVACSTGAWHLVWMRWTGGSMTHGVDVAPTPGQTPASTNGPIGLSSLLRIGANYDASIAPQCADFKALAVGAIKRGLTDSEINALAAYWRTKFGLP